MRVFAASGIIVAINAECPCNEIGVNDFGEVRMGNTHESEGMIKFYAHVDTPVGNVQVDDFAFILQFSQPVTSFKQHFALDDAKDGSDFIVVTSPDDGNTRISGDPYTFNIDGLVKTDDISLNAWFCKGKKDLETKFKECLNTSETTTGKTTEPKTTTPQTTIPNTKKQLANHSKEAWDCDSHDMCVYKFDQEMSFGDAQESCISIGGMLPLPESNKENEMTSKIGSSWLRMYVNDKIVTRFDNFEKRQRAFLNTNERHWEILLGTEPRSFFCIKNIEEGCRNMFRSDKFGSKLFNQGDGKWSIETKQGTLKNLDQKDADEMGDENFPPTTMMDYFCPRKLDFYKKWLKQANKIRLNCIKMENGDFEFALCHNKKCTKFDRFPWFDETIMSADDRTGGNYRLNQLYC